MESFDHICYLDCPHFTVGRVDQWGENGYLLFEGFVYAYEEDRKDQCGRVHSPVPAAEFAASAAANGIVVPVEFLAKLGAADARPPLT